MNVTSDRLTVPQAARRLGIPGENVYRMIFAGEIDGRPDRADGGVYIAIEAVEAYEKKNAAPSP